MYVFHIYYGITYILCCISVAFLVILFLNIVFVFYIHYYYLFIFLVLVKHIY